MCSCIFSEANFHGLFIFWVLKKEKYQLCAVAIDCDNQVINKIGEVLGKKDVKGFQADVNTLKEIYKITDDEINAAGNIERVMIERTALLNLEI